MPTQNPSLSSLEAEVLVIGGGSTGAGVARDAALRGFSTILVERRDLADGTTGRFHGLLHSGGRYAVKDPSAARECIAENRILRVTAADCVEDTGGLFVSTPWDDPEYGDQFLEGCRATGVPAEEIPVAEALRREPRVNPDIRRAFLVPDAALDPWKLVWGCARSAEEEGARILPYHRVLDLEMEGDQVVGAHVRSERSGEELHIRATVVINAAGAWAGQIADLARCSVNVRAGMGLMIAMNHRLVHMCVNRCKRPSDGDILLPLRTACVIGTTDVFVPDPDQTEIRQEDIDLLLDEGEKLVPGFRQARALHAWAGVRPLFEDTAAVAETRDVTRSHALLDHSSREGVAGFLTITGGKTTTFRLMAEAAVDAACEQLGGPRPCTTAEVPLVGSESHELYQISHRLAAREPVPQAEEIICECELITRSRLEDTIKQRDTTSLDDIRRLLRLAMGPCQGGFCIYRAAGILHQGGQVDRDGANQTLLDFLEERWKGVHPILHGDQLRQARLDDWIFQGILDVEHLPV
jgi:glycerol-3-phosphate dehydrogenase